MWCVSDMYAMIYMNSYYTKIVVMCAAQILSRKMKKIKVNLTVVFSGLNLASDIQEC